MSLIENAIRVPASTHYELDVFIPGIPATQGSKSFKGMFKSKKTGRPVPILAESAGAKLSNWREDIRCGLLVAGKPMVDLGRRPVVAFVQFTLPRPKSTPKATPAAIKKPDLDKLIRAVFDAMKSAGVYQDDSQVVALFTSKRLAESIHNDPTGCSIRLMCLDGA